MGILFQTTALQLLKLMIFFGLGFLLMRRHLVPENAPTTLSKLLALVFCPALQLNTLISHINRKALTENASLLLVALGVMAIVVPIGLLLTKHLAGNDPEMRASFRYNFTFSNYGYIGLPLIIAVMGGEMSSRYQFFCVPVSIVCYTYGKMVLQEEHRITLKQMLTPMSISVYLGLLIGFLNLPVPEFAMDVMDGLGGCTGPASMLMSGMVLAHCNLKEAFARPGNYLFALLRLVLIPCAVCGAMYLIGIRGEGLFFTACILSMPFGTNPIIFRQSVNKSVNNTMSASLPSYIISIITVPLIFTLFSHLSGLG